MFVAREHLSHGAAHHFSQQSLRPVFADRCFFEREHCLSFSDFDGGEQVTGPFHRFGENVGSKGDRKKLRRTECAQFFRPAASEVEDSVSADEVKTPFPAWVTVPVRRVM